VSLVSAVVGILAIVLLFSKSRFICSCVQDSTMQHKRRKSHNLRNTLVAIIVLVVVIGAVAVAYQMSAGAGSPRYSDVSNSTTNAGSSCAFSALWTGEINVSGYIFETNNTGVLANDTWTPFYDFANQTSAYARVTKKLDGTVGDVVSWTFWCNDTSNRWSTVPLQNFFVDTDKVLLQIRIGNTTENITIQLFDDMPITVANFKNLVRSGAYNGTIFHRVVLGFVIQGGDLTSKGINWTTIQDENIGLHSNLRGTVAMAKTSSPNSATSQFFINLNDTNARAPAALDSNFSVFGRVIDGMNVADAISQLPIVSNDSSNAGYQRPIDPPVLVVTKFIN
jgi:cyclophilin family peptidyl-prolyl cis-trans isomerase